jgi:dimethylargininase
MFTHAITRLPGENFAQGLTNANLGLPDYPLIKKQHLAYRQALLTLDLDVVVLPDEPAYPDAYFVEDAAIVTPSIAVITRPGALSRLGEEISLQPFLGYYRPLFYIRPPGTIDGGDVLMVGNHFFIGLSERTNHEGASQLSSFLADAGHTSEIVPVVAGLHLKSGISYVGNDILLLTQILADHPAFSSYHRIVLDSDEEYAANSLFINEVLLMPLGFPKTRTKLASLGRRIIEVDVSEVRKMDGGLSCMSLRF